MVDFELEITILKVVETGQRRRAGSKWDPPDARIRTEARCSSYERRDRGTRQHAIQESAMLKLGVVPSHLVERRKHPRRICCPMPGEFWRSAPASCCSVARSRREKARKDRSPARIGSHGPVAGARAGGPVPEARERKSRWPVWPNREDVFSGAMVGILPESNLVLPVFRPRGPLAPLYEATPMIGQQTVVNTQFPSLAKTPDSSAREPDIGNRAR